MRRGAPFTMARTRCTFGFQRRFVRRCEWLSRIPNCGRLPHTSHTDAIGDLVEPGTVEDSSGDRKLRKVSQVTSGR
jgi:hypothetical protein